MTIHEEIQELIPAYAIGALQPDEAARVEAHLGSCGRCTLVFNEYEPVAESLAFAVPLREPPPDLKARTLKYATTRDPPGPTSRPAARFSRFSLRPSYALAGGAFVLALLAVLWMAWQFTELSRELEMQRAFTTTMAYASGTPLTIRGTGAAPQAEGRMYADADENVAAIVMVGLPPLPAGHAYEAWLWQPDGSIVSGGMFTVDRVGNGWLLVRAPQHMSAYSSVGVTVEPAGGAVAPTTPPVLAAKLTLQ